MRITTHPGEMLKEEFMEPLGITATELARRIATTAQTISQLTLKRRSVSPDLAIRLSRAFDTTPHFWLNLQSNHDISVKMTTEAQSYKEITTVMKKNTLTSK